MDVIEGDHKYPKHGLLAVNLQWEQRAKKALNVNVVPRANWDIVWCICIGGGGGGGATTNNMVY